MLLYHKYYSEIKRNENLSNNIYTIRYEDLLLDKRNTLEKLFKFIDLEFNDAIFNEITPQIKESNIFTRADKINRLLNNILGDYDNA